MGKSNRRGKRWELEVRNALNDLPNVNAERLLTENRQGEGYDIDTDLPIRVQCKAGKQPSVYKALAEATEAADGTGEHPVAAVKRSHGRGKTADRFVAMPVADFVEIVGLLKRQGVW